MQVMSTKAQQCSYHVEWKAAVCRNDRQEGPERCTPDGQSLDLGLPLTDAPLCLTVPESVLAFVHASLPCSDWFLFLRAAALFRPSPGAAWAVLHVQEVGSELRSSACSPVHSH